MDEFILHTAKVIIMINNKGLRNGSLASGDRLVNGDTSERINRGSGIKKNLMKGKTYDHTKTGAESIAKNKDIMKTFKTEDQLKTIKNNLQAKENKKFYDKLEKETKQKVEGSTTDADGNPAQTDEDAALNITGGHMKLVQVQYAPND